MNISLRNGIAGLVVASFFYVSTSLAVETMNPIFAEGMVLQQQMAAPIFGTANAGQKITVTFRGDSASGTADAQGKWLVKISTKTAGGPFPLKISGSATTTITGVWVGEVWVGGGQSNMTLQMTSTQQQQVTNDSQIHFFIMPEADMAQLNWPYGSKQWVTVTADHSYPQLAYFFAKEIRKARGVPVGIVLGAHGASTMSCWLRMEAFNSADPALTEWWAPGYIGMFKRDQIVPIQPYGIKGVIWHQGEYESDADIFSVSKIPDMMSSFEKMFRALINEWRADWGQGDFPWLFIQMESYFEKTPPEDKRWAKVREAQRRVSTSLPNMGMATIIDAGLGLHPDYKNIHGARLAKIARAKAYGEQIEYSGPVVESVKRNGDSLAISFTHANGLFANHVHDWQWPLIDFATAGRTDTVSFMEVQAAGASFVPVRAKISGRSVVLDVKGMHDPLNIRYAYANELPPGTMLYNSDTLPATPFLLLADNPTIAKANVTCRANNNSIKTIISNTSMTTSGLSARTTVRICSANGKLVRELVTGIDGRLEWNFTDARGERVSRGMYFMSDKQDHALTIRMTW